MYPEVQNRKLFTILFAQNLSIWSLNLFHINYRFFFYFSEKCFKYFDLDFTESVSVFGRLVIFMVLILTIHKHMLLFHFVVSFCISFSSDLKFSINLSSTCLDLLQNILDFIFFDTMVKENV